MISVIVPVFNAGVELVKFWTQLNSVVKHEVIFVDNASDGRTKSILSLLQKSRSGVTLVTNKENIGFGPANNQGAQLAKYDILVFTQPDVTFNGDVLSSLANSITGGVLYGARLLTGDTGWNFKIPYLEGWFLVCTKQTWETIGGFDPRFVPADFEDIDLSYTASQRGVTLQQLDVRAAHERPGAAWRTVSVDRNAVTVRNQQLFREKWNI